MEDDAVEFGQENANVSSEMESTQIMDSFQVASDSMNDNDGVDNKNIETQSKQEELQHQQVAPQTTQVSQEPQQPIQKTESSRSLTPSTPFSSRQSVVDDLGEQYGTIKGQEQRSWCLMM